MGSTSAVSLPGINTLTAGTTPLSTTPSAPLSAPTSLPGGAALPDSVVSGTDRLTSIAASLSVSTALPTFFGTPIPAESFDMLFKLASSLKKGDLLFIGGDTAVTALTDSKWTHVAMCVDSGDITKGILPKFVESEAALDGVVESPLESVLARYVPLQARNSISYKLVRPTTNESAINAAVDFARSKLGAKYDFSFNQMEDIQNGKYYCSELVFDAYKAAGITLKTETGVYQPSKSNAIIATLKVLGAETALVEEVIKFGSGFGSVSRDTVSGLVDRIKNLPGLKGLQLLGQFSIDLVNQLANAIVDSASSGDISKLQAALNTFKTENLPNIMHSFNLEKVDGFMKYPTPPSYNPPQFKPPAYNPPAYNPPQIGMLTGSYPSVETIWHWEWWGGWPEFRTHWNTFQYPNPVDVANKAAYDVGYGASRAAYEVSYNAQKAYYTTVEFPAQTVAYNLDYAQKMLAHGVAYGIATMVNTGLLATVTAQLGAAAIAVGATYLAPNAQVNSQRLVSPGALADSNDALLSIDVPIPSIKG